MSKSASSQGTKHERKHSKSTESSSSSSAFNLGNTTSVSVQRVEHIPQAVHSVNSEREEQSATRPIASVQHRQHRKVSVQGSLMPQTSPATRELILGLHLRHLRRSHDLPPWKAPAPEPAEPLPVVPVPTSTSEAEQPGEEVHDHHIHNNDVLSSPSVLCSCATPSMALSATIICHHHPPGQALNSGPGLDPAPTAVSVSVATPASTSASVDEVIDQCQEQRPSKRPRLHYNISTALNVDSHTASLDIIIEGSLSSSASPVIPSAIIPEVIQEPPCHVEDRSAENGSRNSGVADLPELEDRMDVDDVPEVIRTDTVEESSQPEAHTHEPCERQDEIIERHARASSHVPSPAPTFEPDVVDHIPRTEQDRYEAGDVVAPQQLPLSNAAASTTIAPRDTHSDTTTSHEDDLSTVVHAVPVPAVPVAGAIISSPSRSSPIGSNAELWNELFGPEPTSADEGAGAAPPRPSSAAQRPFVPTRTPQHAGSKKPLARSSRSLPKSNARILPLKRKRQVERQDLNPRGRRRIRRSGVGAGKLGVEVEPFYGPPRPAKKPRNCSGAYGIANDWVDAINAYLNKTTSGNNGGGASNSEPAPSGGGSGGRGERAGGVPARGDDPFKGYGCPSQVWRPFKKAVLDVEDAKQNLHQDVIRVSGPTFALYIYILRTRESLLETLFVLVFSFVLCARVTDVTCGQETKLWLCIKRLAESESDGSWNNERLAMRDKARAILSNWQTRFRWQSPPGPSR